MALILFCDDDTKGQLVTGQLRDTNCDRYFYVLAVVYYNCIGSELMVA